MNLNIVVPMAGEGKRFSDAGYSVPKPFIKDKDGIMMICHTMSSIRKFASHEDHVYFICNPDHKEYIEAFKKQIEDFLVPSFSIHYVDEKTEGAACTVLTLKDLINNSSPLLILNSDQYIDIDDNFIDYFIYTLELFNHIIVFKDYVKNPKWSFAKPTTDDYITRVSLSNRTHDLSACKVFIVDEVAEKNPISDYATCGLYTFATGRIFVEAAEKMIAANDRTNNEFYVCPVYNHIKTPTTFASVCTEMFGYGTPEDWEYYSGEDRDSATRFAGK